MQHNKHCYGHIQIPKIQGSWVGTGDLATALFFVWIQKYPNDLKKVVENTVASLQGVIIRTKHANSKELLLVSKESIQQMMNPVVKLEAKMIDV